MIIDLHVHSSISPCSVLEMSQILDHARRLGLDGVCITDHQTMAARREVREGLQPDGLLVLVGMEYATTQGDYLIFGPFEEVDPALSAPEMLRLVHEAGGAAIAAHPCRQTRPADPAMAAGGLLAAVERVNGRNSSRENALATLWERETAPEILNGVSGSDAHTLLELGCAPTRFLTPVGSRDELIAALNAGQCEPAFAAPLRGDDRPLRADCGRRLSSPQFPPQAQAKTR